MSTVTISAPVTPTGNLVITAPTSLTYLSDYLNTNRGLAVSIPYGGTGINLTSMGRFNSGSVNSVWRLRNGTNTTVSATLKSYPSETSGGFSAQYDLPGGTDTFVASSVFRTHSLIYSGGSINKAATTQTFKYEYDLSNATQFNLIGGTGNDVLTGAATPDLLIGKGGNDTLTGGGGSDKFVFTNEGIDTITDFNVGSGGDIFAITSTAYTGAPAANTTAIIGNAQGVLTNNVNNYIVVDTLQNILGISSTNTRFAYNTTSNQLLYDADGNWSNGSVVIANTNSFNASSIASSNFAFI